MSLIKLTLYEPLGLGLRANPFSTPYVILPECYPSSTLSLLWVLLDKLVNTLPLTSIPIIFLALPLVENMFWY